VRNELLQFAIAPDVPASTFNADKTLHQGIEAGLDLQLMPWATLRQTYQFNDFRFERDAQFGNNRLPVVPKHLYRAALRLGPDKWHIEPMVEWVPGGAWADHANSFRAGGYATLNLSGAVTIGDQAEFFVDARNLTSKRAVGDISAVVDYRLLQPFERAIFYPIQQRSVFAGIRMRW
jgi:iron complex outermembrane receptor protein